MDPHELTRPYRIPKKTGDSNGHTKEKIKEPALVVEPKKFVDDNDFETSPVKQFKRRAPDDRRSVPQHRPTPAKRHRTPNFSDNSKHPPEPNATSSPLPGPSGVNRDHVSHHGLGISQQAAHPRTSSKDQIRKGPSDTAKEDSTRAVDGQSRARTGIEVKNAEEKAKRKHVVDLAAHPVDKIFGEMRTHRVRDKSKSGSESTSPHLGYKEGERPLTRAELQRHLHSLQSDDTAYEFLRRPGLMERLLGHKMLTGRIESHTHMGYERMNASDRPGRVLDLSDMTDGSLGLGSSAPPPPGPLLRTGGPRTPPMPKTPPESPTPQQRQARGPKTPPGSPGPSTPPPPVPHPPAAPGVPTSDAHHVIQSLVASTGATPLQIRNIMGDDVIKALHNVSSEVFLDTLRNAVQSTLRNDDTGRMSPSMRSSQSVGMDLESSPSSSPPSPPPPPPPPPNLGPPPMTAPPPPHPPMMPGYMGMVPPAPVHGHGQNFGQLPPCSLGSGMGGMGSVMLPPPPPQPSLGPPPAAPAPGQHSFMSHPPPMFMPANSQASTMSMPPPPPMNMSMPPPVNAPNSFVQNYGGPPIPCASGNMGGPPPPSSMGGPPGNMGGPLGNMGPPPGNMGGPLGNMGGPPSLGNLGGPPSLGNMGGPRPPSLGAMGGPPISVGGSGPSVGMGGPPPGGMSGSSYGSAPFQGNQASGMNMSYPPPAMSQAPVGNNGKEQAPHSSAMRPSFYNAPPPTFASSAQKPVDQPIVKVTIEDRPPQQMSYGRDGDQPHANPSVSISFTPTAPPPSAARGSSRMENKFRPKGPPYSRPGRGEGTRPPYGDQREKRMGAGGSPKRHSFGGNQNTRQTPVPVTPSSNLRPGAPPFQSTPTNSGVKPGAPPLRGDRVPAASDANVPRTPQQADRVPPVFSGSATPTTGPPPLLPKTQVPNTAPVSTPTVPKSVPPMSNPPSKSFAPSLCGPQPSAAPQPFQQNVQATLFSALGLGGSKPKMPATPVQQEPHQQSMQQKQNEQSRMFFPPRKPQQGQGAGVEGNGSVLLDRYGKPLPVPGRFGAGDGAGSSNGGGLGAGVGAQGSTPAPSNTFKSLASVSSPFLGRGKNY